MPQSECFECGSQLNVTSRATAECSNPTALATATFIYAVIVGNIRFVWRVDRVQTRAARRFTLAAYAAPVIYYRWSSSMAKMSVSTGVAARMKVNCSIVMVQ